MPMTSEIVITLRVPSERRAICTTACTADAICLRTARSGMLKLAIETMFSIRTWSLWEQSSPWHMGAWRRDKNTFIGYYVAASSKPGISHGEVNKDSGSMRDH